MELKLLMPGKLSVMHPHDIVETACGDDILKLRVPLEAQDARVRALQRLLFGLLLGVIDDDPAVEKSDGEDVLLLVVPGEAATGTRCWHRGEIYKVHRISVELLDDHLPLC